MAKRRRKSKTRKILLILLLIAVLVLGSERYMVMSTAPLIKVNMEEGSLKGSIETVRMFGGDCIIVLGAAVKPDGTPSPMLRDRLDMAASLYNMGAAPKVLLSGDNGQVEYNEVAAMKKYLISKGIPPADLISDHAGFSTYETLHRAKSIFQVKKAIITTQKYHLYRALYIGKSMGIDVLGAASAGNNYNGQSQRTFREVLARYKDFFKCIYKPDPKFLGDPIPIR